MDTPSEDEQYAIVKGEFMREKATFYLLDPSKSAAGAAGSEAGASGAKQASGLASDVDSEAGPVKVLYMYWYALGLNKATCGKSSDALVVDTMAVDVPLQSGTLVRYPILPKAKRCDEKLHLEVPFITNQGAIKANTRLIVKRVTTT